MKIVVALDGSRPGERAVEAVAPLAQAAGAEVVLLAVLDYDRVHETWADVDVSQRVPVRATPAAPAAQIATPSPVSAEDRGQALERARLEATEYLEAQAARCLPGLKTETRVEWSGEAARTIVDFAAARNADLVAVGTHGRTGLRHVLMGSVAEDVVRHARVPVLVARAWEGA
ncbi:MAG: universal stress protein [Dehalococcoidia bacterium]|nr:universal stress protein [Dehalococcoidia bacterium]